jgi:nuclear pore complex protein Nup107
MRALWKRACRAIAQNVRSPNIQLLCPADIIQPLLSAGERRVYAALISDLPTLLPACETWEDHLWAHVQAGMESRLERRLDELGGFWNSEDGLLGRDEVMQNVTGSLNVVFEGIAGVQNEKVMYVEIEPVLSGDTDD